MIRILSKRLRNCRNDKGLTQEQVAEHCKITVKAYQNYERMRREPKLRIIIRIADFYDVSLDYLVGRTNVNDAS